MPARACWFESSQGHENISSYHKRVTDEQPSRSAGPSWTSWHLSPSSTDFRHHELSPPRSPQLRKPSPHFVGAPKLGYNSLAVPEGRKSGVLSPQIGRAPRAREQNEQIHESP